MTWESSFVAMSVALGEDAEDARAAMSEAFSTGTVTALVSALKAESRATRAQALARELGPILTAIEKLEVAWR